MTGEANKARPWQVGDLVRSVKALLETQWPRLWVEGEVAQVSRPPSGHVYFTLADEREKASLPCVMYAREARRSGRLLRPGERVVLRGRLSMYVARGSFQLVADQAEPAGAGALAAQLERLRRKLAAEGLFDPARKRPLPRFPGTIGVVTSRSGAAFRDVLRVTAGRAPVRIVLADCRVQGAEAPASIVAALRRIQRLEDLDVVLLVRGGGSAEDLQAFNDERVVRAVAACRVPLVSGVGHEVDVTLTDLAADVRAATPSNAAELAVPDREALRTELRELEGRLGRALDGTLARARTRLHRATVRLARLRGPVRLEQRRLQVLLRRLRGAMARHLAEARDRHLALERRLLRAEPRLRLRSARSRLQRLQGRLRAAMLARLATHRRRLAEQTARLDALSPLGVLGRGYALVWHEPSGHLLRDATQARPGDALRIQVQRGQLRAVVSERAEHDEGHADGARRQASKP